LVLPTACTRGSGDVNANGGTTQSGASGGREAAGGRGGAAGIGGSATGGTDVSGAAGRGAGGEGTSGGRGGSENMGGKASDGGSGGESRRTLVFVGSGDWANEPGKVTVFSLNRAALKLELLGDAPAGGLASFMAIDTTRQLLFVADEKDGGVISFAVDSRTGTLTNLGTTASANHPVSLALSPDGKYLLGANYNEGSVDVYPIAEDGKAQASAQTLATASHAHSVMFDAQGRVLVANEGADSISHLTFSAGKLTAATPASSGSFSPRHMALDATGRVYVASERGDFVTAYTREATGALSQLWQEARLDKGSPTENTGADIHLTPDSRFLYATNRGTSNTVVGFDLTGATPKLLGHVSSMGDTPRNFSMDPEGQFILVGNQGKTKTLALFHVGADGKLGEAAVQSTAFSPNFVHLVQF
jgi:6-phosphogluconolactonase